LCAGGDYQECQGRKRVFGEVTGNTEAVRNIATNFSTVIPEDLVTAPQSLERCGTLDKRGGSLDRRGESLEPPKSA